MSRDLIDELAQKIANLLGAAEMLSGSSMDCVPLIEKALREPTQHLGEMGEVVAVVAPMPRKRRPSCF